MDIAGVEALFRFNRWANDQVLAGVSAIPDSAFRRQLHSQPEGSLRGVLTHIVWSEWIWLQRWTGATDLVFQPADVSQVPGDLVFRAEDCKAIDSLQMRFRVVGEETAEYVRRLAPADLERTVTYRTPSGAAWSRVLWRQLVHTVNHSTYHRGQVALLLRAQGYLPTPSDFIGLEDDVL